MEPDPPILDYHKPDPPSWKFVANAGLFVLGVGVAVGAMFFAGCGVFNAFGYPLEGPRLSSRPILPPILFFGASFVVAAVMTFKWTSIRRSWFFMGLLFGVGVMALLEGICFVGG